LILTKDSMAELDAVSIPTTVEIIEGEYNQRTIRDVSKARLPSPSEAHIRLDQQEQKLFQVIVETVDAFGAGKIELTPEDQEKEGDLGNSNRSSNHQRRRPTLRVAGGWVRDKLLGLTTHDVDLAVDDLTGVQFANLILSYLKSTNQQHLMQSSKIGVIAANPAQSKHLETATLKVHGIDIDIANLRAQEVYAQDSRIPTVRFGTPLEDSERRDFTVNALFFNLHTQCVEDWTKRGMSDLFYGRLVTPLEPVQTFHDDPLRVLRAVRFGVRYQFDLNDDLAAACRRVDIHQALHRKVSRERVGKELEGMLSGTGARPIDAINTIAKLQLAGSVFALPALGHEKVTAVQGHVLQQPYHNLDFNSDQAREIRQHGWEEAQCLIQILPTVLKSHDASIVAAKKLGRSFSNVDHRLLPIAVFLLPFRTLRYQEKNKVDKSYNVAQYIFQHGIKFKMNDVKAMTLLQEKVDTMAQLVRQASSSDTPAQNAVHLSRLETGLLLRACKELWPTCLLLSLVLLIREDQKDGTGDALSKWTKIGKDLCQGILDLNLDGCWKVTPLLDGKAVIKTLEIPRGPQVGLYLEEEVKWMLQNPDGSREECEEHLRSYKRSLENAPSDVLGRSDASGQATPIASASVGHGAQHFSKKVHVESGNGNP